MCKEFHGEEGADDCRSTRKDSKHRYRYTYDDKAGWWKKASQATKLGESKESSPSTDLGLEDTLGEGLFESWGKKKRKKFMQKTKKVIKKAGKSIKKGVKKVGKAVKKVGKAVKAAVKKATDKLKMGFKKATSKLKKAFKDRMKKWARKIMNKAIGKTLTNLKRTRKNGKAPMFYKYLPAGLRGLSPWLQDILIWKLEDWNRGSSSRIKLVEEETMGRVESSKRAFKELQYIWNTEAAKKEQGVVWRWVQCVLPRVYAASTTASNGLSFQVCNSRHFNAILTSFYRHSNPIRTPF